MKIVRCPSIALARPPSKDRMLICLDFSQIELRIMAILSKDPLMSRVLNDPNGDIHQTTADGFHVPRDPTAKQCNFLLIFGGGGWMLSRGLTLAGVPTSETVADGYVRGFDGLYPRVSEYRREMMTFHARYGFVPLLTGRTRVIENVTSSNHYLRHQAETQMANNIVQGSAQDVMKAALIRSDPLCVNPDAELPKCMKLDRLHRAMLADNARKLDKLRREFVLAKLRWHLQVHDEALFSVEASAAHEIGCKLAELFGWHPYWPTITPIDVPLRAEGGIGYTWAEAKKPSDSSRIIVAQT